MHYRGKRVYAKRVQFYCKRSAYSHGYVWGWELRELGTDRVVVSGQPRNRGADRAARVPYKTKAALLAATGLREV